MKKIFLAMTAAAMSVALFSCGSTEKEQVSEVSSEVSAVKTDLVIPVSEVTETAKFYPVTVDGTDMEVFAVRDSEGNIRTAFNTCQQLYFYAADRIRAMRNGVYLYVILQGIRRTYTPKMTEYSHVYAYTPFVRVCIIS